MSEHESVFVIAESMLEDDSLPLSIRHFVVNQPANGQGNAAKDQQRAKGLEDQTN